MSSQGLESEVAGIEGSLAISGIGKAKLLEMKDQAAQLNGNLEKLQVGSFRLPLAPHCREGLSARPVTREDPTFVEVPPGALT